MSQNFPFQALAFYRFVPIEKAELAAIEESLIETSKRLNIAGLIILAEEGINGTIAGLEADTKEYQKFIESFPWAKGIEFKLSPSHFQPFRRFKVNIREEIVTSKSPDLVPDGKHKHLSPEQWNAWLNSEDPPLILDTRNDYESRIGTFKGAITPPIKKFQEFAKFLEKSGLPKDKPLLMFCTGGIRCEKAILEAERIGYQNTYQLEGGILKYLEEYPQGEFEGECFVFDNRVAVDAQLRPSATIRLCPLCGEPGSEEISCGHCHKPGVMCQNCRHKNACSKNCANHLGVLRT